MYANRRKVKSNAVKVYLDDDTLELFLAMAKYTGGQPSVLIRDCAIRGLDSIARVSHQSKVI